MKFKHLLLLTFTLVFSLNLMAQQPKTYTLQSPDKQITVTISAEKEVTWAAKLGSDNMILPSTIAMQLKNGIRLGKDVKVASAKTTAASEKIETHLYKKQFVDNTYNQIDLKFKNKWGIIFRAYNDGVAYRIYTLFDEDIVIANEVAQFNLPGDNTCFVPYIRDLRSGDKYSCAYEAQYDVIKMSEFVNDSLAFLPVLFEAKNGKKAVILESDLEAYPGMYLTNNKEVAGFQSHFAPYPLETKPGGFNSLNMMVKKRADYIAKTKGNRSFPWRAVVFSSSDKDLANNDMAFKLASPSRVADVSWVKPGKVAWDWWNNWNISRVDFRAGINTETYKYYIDFASANGIEYVVLDEGWSGQNDLLTISPNIDLQAIVDHGKQKNVSIILWSTWQAMDKAMGAAMKKYSEMGVKGFKIDFLDRDDQQMVESVYAIADLAAKYKLMVDYHGMYKPSGINRVFPNVINFEGVHGLENCKWATYDAPKYDVTIPYIRMMAGPMDYTPGGFRNVSQSNYRPSNDNPMTMGTRCHQLGMYVVYEAPLQMLADNPTTYMNDQECTNFMVKFPTVYDETIALDGKVGEYVAIAREKGNNWYIGALTNWTPRKLTIDLSFLEEGTYEAVIFSDGINADRDGTDYKTQTVQVKRGDKINVDMAAGGGWAAQLIKK